MLPLMGLITDWAGYLSSKGPQTLISVVWKSLHEDPKNDTNDFDKQRIWQRIEHILEKQLIYSTYRGRLLFIGFNKTVFNLIICLTTKSFLGFFRAFWINIRNNVLIHEWHNRYLPLPTHHQPHLALKHSTYGCAVWLVDLLTHPHSTARISIRIRQFTPVHRRKLLCIDVLE